MHNIFKCRCKPHVLRECTFFIAFLTFRHSHTRPERALMRSKSRFTSVHQVYLLDKKKMGEKKIVHRSALLHTILLIKGVNKIFIYFLHIRSDTPILIYD